MCEMYQMGFGALTPNVTRFLIAIIASFLIFAVVGQSFWGAFFYSKLALDPARAILGLEPWRLFTYAFLHDRSSPMHVIFNGLLLFMIGPTMEERWGEKRFLIFVLVAILMGALFVVAAFFLGLGSSWVVGFSSATIGLLVAWGLAYPDHQIYVLGILPLSGRALVYVTIGIELLYAFSSSTTSSAAHFGGIVTAFIFSFGLYKPQRIKQLYRQMVIKNKLRRIK